MRKQAHFPRQQTLTPKSVALRSITALPFFIVHRDSPIFTRMQAGNACKTRWIYARSGGTLIIYYAADVPFIFITIVTAGKNTKAKNVYDFITLSYEVMPLS
jgi:hypothetical protein